MKSVLISIRPKWVEKIARGEKTIEVRKTAPKEVPFKAYIYCTKEKTQNDIIWAGAFGYRGKWNGHIIGEFICYEVYELKYDYCDGVDIDDDLILDTCLDREDINIYAKGKTLYGWHISDLNIYDKPKELSKVKISCNRKNLCYSCNRFTGKPWDICNNTITCPPESWLYVEEV